MAVVRPYIDCKQQLQQYTHHHTYFVAVPIHHTVLLVAVDLVEVVVVANLAFSLATNGRALAKLGCECDYVHHDNDHPHVLYDGHDHVAVNADDRENVANEDHIVACQENIHDSGHDHHDRVAMVIDDDVQLVMVCGVHVIPAICVLMRAVDFLMEIVVDLV